MAEVSSVTFHYVLKALEKTTNISIEKMLNEVELSPLVLSKHDGKIDSKKLSFIFRYCMKESNNPALALHIGQAVSYQSLGLLGYLLLNTSSLKQMIEKFNYYQKVISGYFKFQFFDDGIYYKLAIYINENPMIPVPSFHAQVHLSSIVSILTQILGQKVTPEFTYFSQDVDENLMEYQKNIWRKYFFFQKMKMLYFLKLID